MPFWNALRETATRARVAGDIALTPCEDTGTDVHREAIPAITCVAMSRCSRSLDLFPERAITEKSERHRSREPEYSQACRFSLWQKRFDDGRRLDCTYRIRNLCFLRHFKASYRCGYLYFYQYNQQVMF